MFHELLKPLLVLLKKASRSTVFPLPLCTI